MTTYKTVLAPGAPWPVVGEPAITRKPKPKTQQPPKLKGVSRHKQTDKNFENWVSKSNDSLLTGAVLGMSIKQEIKQKTKKAEVFKRPSLEPKQIFYFSKAKASK